MHRAFVALILAPVSYAAAQSAPVHVPDAERWPITSRLSGDRYELAVMLPRGADRSVPRPMLVVLDGTEDFALASSVMDLTRAECELKNAPLVVAIGDGARIDADGNRRGRDYTPTRSNVSWARGEGGAPVFLTFLADEVLPAVQARYRLSDDRALFGYSYGGLFAAHALVERPALFSRWILGSPSTFYDSSVVVRRAAAMSPLTDTGPRVLLTAGQRERWAIDGNRELAAALRTRLGAAAIIDTVVFPGVGHAMGKLDAMRRGFGWAFCANGRGARP
jgi:predicted alpha/beta superfamily hydrolase